MGAAENDAVASADADGVVAGADAWKKSGGVAGWGEGDCDDESSEAGDMDSARADEAAQAAKATSALALALVPASTLALTLALVLALVLALALAFAVARLWAGRARALGLALVPLLALV